MSISSIILNSTWSNLRRMHAYGIILDEGFDPAIAEGTFSASFSKDASDSEFARYWHHS